MHRKLPAFEVLVDLARNDPERLEILRTELTSQVIAAAPNEHRRKRLEGIQFRIDLERQRARSPLAAAIKLSEMMCHSLAELHRSMVTPLAQEQAQRNNAPRAKVLEFSPPLGTPVIVDP